MQQAITALRISEFSLEAGVRQKLEVRDQDDLSSTVEGEADWLQQHVVDHLLQLSAEARVAVRRFDDKRNGTTALGALERQNSSSSANYVEFAVYAPAVWPGKSCFLNLWVYLLDQHAAISERAADGGRLSKLEGDASGEELPLHVPLQATIEFDDDDIHVSSPPKPFKWNGRHRKLQFEIQCAEEAQLGFKVGTATIQSNSEELPVEFMFRLELIDPPSSRPSSPDFWQRVGSSRGKFGDTALREQTERLVTQPTSAVEEGVPLPDPEQWRHDNEMMINEVVTELGVDLSAPNLQANLRHHLFLGHRQIGGGAQVGELYEIWRSLGVTCWRDLAQPLPDTTAMIHGVAESSVYTLYLTKDSLSKYVLLEAWAAMKFCKPVIILMEGDSRKPSYAGGSIEEATYGWPQDLIQYFSTGKFVTWGGQPMAWGIRDQNAKLGSMLDCCTLWQSEGRAPVPSGRATWSDALKALGSRGSELEREREPELEREHEPEPAREPEPVQLAKLAAGQHHVFISYTNESLEQGKDAAFQALLSNLKVQGLNVFNPKQDVAGEQLSIDDMRRHAANSMLLLAVLSPRFFDSKYCRAEVEAAAESAFCRAVIPVYAGQYYTHTQTTALMKQKDPAKQKAIDAAYKLNVMDVHNLAHMEDCVASIRMKIVARVQDPVGAPGVGEATVAGSSKQKMQGAHGSGLGLEPEPEPELESEPEPELEPGTEL